MWKQIIWTLSLCLCIIWLAILGNYLLYNSDYSDCIEITDEMTIKKAKQVRDICLKRIDELKLEHDSLTKRQLELTTEADRLRHLINDAPVKKEEKKEAIYIHQHLNPLPPVTGSTARERFENLVKYYAVWFWPEVFVEVWRRYKIAEELLACIAYAETHIGNDNKSKNNIMNYWNNDRWQKVAFATVLDNVMAAAHWLREWTYLSKNRLLWELSNWGRASLWLKPCETKWVYCYATSWVNWRWNVNDCLTFIHWKNKDWDNYVF